jgi:two-component system, cell cycle response regulator DivK
MPPDPAKSTALYMSEAWPLHDSAAPAENRSDDLSSGDRRPLPDPGRGPQARPLGRVLIVDDAWDAREMYALYFRSVGYDAITADDGQSAIDATTRLKPDVIVMDLAMPGMSGITASRHLKNDPGTRKIPIILLTGHGARAIQEGALESGVDAFLTKPCLPEDLEAHVQRLIQARRRPTP